jgi:hypothetical protein
MQDLVDAVRATGARNVILLGGVRYAGALSQWLSYRPVDPLHNLAAAVHFYSPGACTTPSCWGRMLAPVAQQVPLVVGEMGEHDCAYGYIDRLMPWLDRHGVSYLAWTWNTWDCASGLALITDHSGTPTNFGLGLQKHLAALSSSPR